MDVDVGVGVGGSGELRNQGLGVMLWDVGGRWAWAGQGRAGAEVEQQGYRAMGKG